MEKKYELVMDNTIEINNHILYRIRALKDFNNVKKGDLGGYIEKESNLSHEGDCWVYGNAKVYGEARVYDNAKVFSNAKVYDKAQVCDNAMVFTNTIIYDNALVCGNMIITGCSSIGKNAYITEFADCITIGPIGSRNGYTTFYKDIDGNIYVSWDALMIPSITLNKQY